MKHFKFTFLRSFAFSVFAFILATGCSKKDHLNIPTTNIGFVDSAFQFLRSTLETEELKQIDFENYTRLTLEGQDRFVEIQCRQTNKLILVEKTIEGFQGYTNVLNIDGASSNNGTLICEDLDHYRKTTVSFVNGKVTSIERTTNGKLNPYARISNDNILEGISVKPLATEDIYAELPTVYVYGGGGGGSSFLLFSMFYMTNMNDFYYYSYTPGIMSPGGGGGGSYPAPKASSVVNIPTHLAATKPINIAKELSCFKNVPGATYKLSVNVNQPTPNSRDVMNLTANRKVGHTFVTLEQRNPNGTVFTRNVGWYPESSAKPADGLTNGVYQDDSATPFAVGLTVVVTAQEFNKVVEYLLGVNQYSVSDANCTNIAVNAFGKANVKLPQTIGYVYTQTNNYVTSPSGKAIVFQGVNPADLGQDIRAMNATTFSQNNGGRMVWIDKANSNTQYKSRTGN